MKRLQLIWQELIVITILILSLAWVFPKVQSAFMTSIIIPCITTLVAFSVIGLILLFFKEQASDEREELHRYIASRYGYLAGSLVLLIGIVVETAHNRFNEWLVLTLLVMIFTKIASRIYATWHR